MTGRDQDTLQQRSDHARDARRPLSAREREVLGYLAEGLSGAAIAERLVLSPETIRTHVRNAMEKLRASTRSQAVAIALESGEIGDSGGSDPAPAARVRQPQAPANASAKAIMTALLTGVTSLPDVESGAIYFAEDGGMLLRLAASASSATGAAISPPPEITMGDSGIGRVALERRARLITSGKQIKGPILASPMAAGGKLTGVLVIGVRASRPTSRRELLLIEAFANRVAEIVAAGVDSAALRQALQRFRASWTETFV